MEYQQYLELLRIIIACSIFFVWVVRYQNIVEEFKAYGLPNSLRDGIGITKLSCAYMLATNNPTFISIAASVLAFDSAFSFSKIHKSYYDANSEESSINCLASCATWLLVAGCGSKGQAPVKSQNVLYRLQIGLNIGRIDLSRPDSSSNLESSSPILFGIELTRN